MKNVVKKGIFFLCICLFTSNFVNAVEPAVTITASSSTIGDWSKTYNAGTANEIKLEVGGGAAMASKKPCGVSTNQSVLSLSSSDSHYLSFELPSGSNATIDSILFRLSGNSSGTSDWFSPLFSCDETTFNTNKITGVVDVHFTGYDQACTDKMAKLTNGTKSCRMYRRVKYTPGTPGSIGSGSNYGSGQTTNITYIEVYLSGGAPVTPTVNSVTVSPASATLDPNDTQQLTATVDATPASADKSVTWSSSDPSVATVSESGLVTAVAQGTATITATSNLDNTKSGTCSVTVNAPAAPIPVTAIALNKSTTNIAIGDSETLTIIYTPAEANTGKAVTWTSSNTSVATVDNSGKVIGVTVGTATITATSTTDASITASCAVTVQAVAVTGVSINPTSANLQIGGSTDLTYTILPANATDKSVSWSSSNTSVATVNNGHVTAIAAGTATITVTTTDGNKTATCSVTVTAGPPVPSTTLTLHEPGLYEADEFEGGYGLALATLTEDNVTREYEVYYLSNNNGDFISAGNPQYDIDKSQAPGHKLASGNGGSVDAGWVKTIGSGNFTSKAPLNMGEFQAANSNYMSINDAHYIELHIKGFDQFSMIANDKSAVQPDKTGQDKKAGEHLKIFIDNTPLERGASDMKTEDPSLFRFPISTGEHVIKIAGTGSTNNRFRAFSLRVAQEPRTKYVDGNDSTQEVLQTTAPQAVYYYTKYNSLGETRLEWDGAQGTGFTLETVGSSEVGDTLALGGTAQCPVGEYHYFVKTYFNGVETSSVPGKIKVTSLIKPKGATRCEAYQNEAIDDIRFTYYALSGDDITLTWENNKIPAGISGHGANGTYIISGTPTQVDTFVYTISVLGGNSISDTLFVDKLDLGNDPILYLYKNDGAKAKDGTYKYLTSAGGGNKNLVARKAKADGKRSADQYSKYKWILISEDVDANNEEVLAIARGEVDLPVLNMKSFTYAPGRLNWGEPDNGSLTDRGRFITVYRDDHPIFQALNKHKGDSIMVLDPVEGKGLMPIDVNYGGVCLATALTRDIDDYYGDGPERTIMHEVERLNGKKYICFPIGMEGSNHLTADGKRLLNQTITYLLSNDATIKAPSLAITQFRVGSYDGVIDDENSVITLNVKEEDSELMKAAKPVITLASPMTFVTPNSGEAVNFIEAPSGIRYVVSDYVTKRNYKVIVRLYNPQGIDNIEVGTWLNIFDVYGRKVATTNQDIRTMDLPHGMYIVVTESGQTIKIMR